jgi:hypothetical protein
LLDLANSIYGQTDGLAEGEHSDGVRQLLSVSEPGIGRCIGLSTMSTMQFDRRKCGEISRRDDESGEPGLNGATVSWPPERSGGNRVALIWT